MYGQGAAIGTYALTTMCTQVVVVLELSSGFYKIAGCKSTEHRAWNTRFMTIKEADC